MTSTTAVASLNELLDQRPTDKVIAAVPSSIETLIHKHRFYEHPVQQRQEDAASNGPAEMANIMNTRLRDNQVKLQNAVNDLIYHCSPTVRPGSRLSDAQQRRFGASTIS